MKNLLPDIKANITLTGRDYVQSGYRPAHMIGNYLTTGMHEYLHAGFLKKGETAEGLIYFISPQYYPHSLTCGMKISFQEGSRITGYAEVLEIYNDVLCAK